MLCLALSLCGFTSNKGGVSGIETVMFYYQTDKLPKNDEIQLTMYVSKSKEKYSGFVTSTGTSSQIKSKVTVEPFKNAMVFGKKWYYCHTLINITPECKEKLNKGQLKVDLDKSFQSKKSEKMSKREIKKVLGVIVIAIGYAIILSKVTGRRKKVD